MAFSKARAALAAMLVLGLPAAARASDCLNVYESRRAALGPDVPRDWHYDPQGIANYLLDRYDVTGTFTLTGLGVSYDPLKWSFEAVGRGVSAALGGTEFDASHQIATFEYSQASTGASSGYCEIADEFNTGHISVYACYVRGPDGAWVAAGTPDSPLRARPRYLQECSLTALSYEPGRSPAVHDRSAIHPPLAAGIYGGGDGAGLRGAGVKTGL